MKPRTKQFIIATAVLCTAVIYFTYIPAGGPSSPKNEDTYVNYEVEGGELESGRIEFQAWTEDTHPITDETVDYNVEVTNAAEGPISVPIQLVVYQTSMVSDAKQVRLDPGETRQVTLQHDTTTRPISETFPYGTYTIYPSIVVGNGRVTIKQTVHRPVTERRSVWLTSSLLVVLLGYGSSQVVKQRLRKIRRKRELAKQAKSIGDKINSDLEKGKKLEQPRIFKNDSISETENKISEIENSLENTSKIKNRENLLEEKYVYRILDSIATAFEKWDKKEIKECNSHTNDVLFLVKSLQDREELIITVEAKDSIRVSPSSLLSQVRLALQKGNREKVQKLAKIIKDVKALSNEWEKLPQVAEFDNKIYYIVDGELVIETYEQGEWERFEEIISHLKEWQSIAQRLQQIEKDKKESTFLHVSDDIHSALSDSDIQSIKRSLSEYKARSSIPVLNELIQSVDLSHTKFAETNLREDIDSAIRTEDWDYLIELVEEIEDIAHRAWTHDDVMEYSAEDFEHLVARLWKDHGFEVSTTKLSNDKGIDAVARDTESNSDIAIQAKRWARDNPVGSPTCRKVVGAAHDADRAIIVTTSRFTDSAREYSKNVGQKLQLVNGNKLLRMLSRSSLVPPD